MHPFDVATGVTRVAEGRWAAEVDPGWFALMGPNGGYLASLVLRAMTGAVADPGRAPRSLTSLSARLEQDDRLCLLALAAFAVDMPSGAQYAGAPPAATPCEELERFDAPDGMPPIVHRLDLRPAIGAPPFSGAGEARTGLAFDTPRAVDALACATFVDAWWPAPFARLTSPIAAPTIDLSIHFRVRLPPDGEQHAARAPELGVLAQGRQLALAGLR